jgi:chromosome segregation ATPase
MDAIKKKMVKLTNETETATIRADKFDAIMVKGAKEADRIEEELRHLTKKFGAKESQYDSIIEDLFNASLQLEEKEKVASSAEQDVGSLSRAILLKEEEADKRENRLATAISDLLRASIRADEQIKLKNHIELDISTNEEDMDGIESQLKDAKSILEESERKYDDIYRKHVNLESEAARATERAELEEKKISELEEELKIVGQNLQQLEVSEEKAMAREEAYQKQIRELLKRLKEAETMAENSEMNIQRLNIRIDQIEDDTLYEKLKIKAISDDLDGTFTQMANI